jgi:SAM-dependent methyltransferase
VSPVSADARERFRARFDAYCLRHPGEVTPEMLRLWEGWMGSAWDVAVKANAEADYLEEEPLRERRRLAAKHLTGDGIEIGALHNPLPVPDGARVHYVDNHDTGALQLLYYEVSSFKFVDVEIVDDGERLASIADGSYDFVISNHFLEHCQDPVGALASHVRVLKRGGVLYCAVPDCRRTFDSVRERTTFEHVWRDHVEGPARSRREHYQDFSSRVNGRSGEEHEAWWRMLDALDFSIHFHVWTPWDVLELVTETRKRLGLSLDLREFVAHGNECVVILEKR